MTAMMTILSGSSLKRTPKTKNMGEASSNIEINDRVQAGIEDEPIDGILNGREETPA